MSIDVLEINVADQTSTPRQFTASEKKAFAEYRAEAATMSEIAAQAEADREAAKASALAKLEALGLTADEAAAIAGF
jgi:hypothetical protein